MTLREKEMEIFKKLESLGFFDWLSESHNLRDTDMKPEYLDELPLNDIHRTVCNSMAFRWFREKYGLNAISPTRIYKSDFYQSRILNWNNWEEIYPNQCDTYEEAELACLVKLIEIIKNK